MTNTTDHKARRARTELLAHQFNRRLAAEGLSVKARQDRKAIAREAAAEVAARRQAWEMRHRPGYASAEAQQPFEAQVRLIRREDGPKPIEAAAASASPSKPTFEAMRAERDAFPDTPQEVHEHNRRRREQRRTNARAQEQASRDRKKNSTRDRPACLNS